jgi:hypothetical protein
MADAPDWIRPGDTATLLWHGARADRPGGPRMYQVAGPALEGLPPAPRFLLAPTDREDFAARLYRGGVGLPALRDFLSECRIARGELIDDGEFLAVTDEAPVLPLIEDWKAGPGRPRVPYLEDLGAFMPAEMPLYVDPVAHAAAQREPELFRVAWVCDECGDAADAGTFLWTVHQEDGIRVCLLIHNDAGIWQVSLHPFDFPKETAA